MRIVVVGDVLLDRDLDGPSTRLAPDAPVPVIDVETITSRAGGAGLVARLLASDGHEVTLVTALSDDGPGRELRRLLGGVELVAGKLNAPTPVKTRVLKAGEPVARLDEGCGRARPPSVSTAMLHAIAAADALVVADYGRGLLADHDLREALAGRAGQVPLVWDPHPRGSDPVAGVAAVTPNLAEALGRTGVDARADEAHAHAAAALQQAWGARTTVVTLGDTGAWLHSGPGPADGRLVPATPLEEVDPCGAGDRFSGALAAALAAAESEDPAHAVAAAIAATERFLRSGGVAGLPRPPAPSATARSGLADAAELLARVRRGGGTVVATGGCFDLLHAGHLRTLRAARAQGDALVVCLNSDASVRRLKGPQRPLMSEQDREELLLALDCVDAVVLFDEDSPVRVLEELRPDVWVKGGDYIAELLPEYAAVTAWGGTCVTVPFSPGRSTTALVRALERIA